MLPFLTLIYQKIIKCAQYLSHNWLPIIGDRVYEKWGNR